MRSPDWNSPMVMLATVAALAGCGGTEPNGEPGLTLISGAGITDTIEAELPEPLVGQLLDSGGVPIANQRILFQSRDCVDYCPVYLAPLGSTQYVTAVEDTTDAQGTASVRVKLGYPAGEGLVRVTVPERGLVTTATYIVAPGRPAFLGRDPFDTTLYVGGHYVLRPITYDRVLNPREGDDVTFALVDGPVTVADGGTVTATAIGRARIEARLGPLADTSYVSVVPVGRLAVTWGLSDTTEVRTIELDGSGLQTVASSGLYDGGHPAWTPTGAIVFVKGGGEIGPSRLVITGPFGLHRLLGNITEEEMGPSVSLDGEWTYFQTTESNSYGGGEIWRVHLDGTSPERVGAPGDPDFADIEPDPSPDDTRLVYVSSRPDGVRRIVVRDLATGVDHPLGLEGRRPGWSPLGDWIAYLKDAEAGGGTIRLVRPDGSDDHQVSLDGRGYTGNGLTWSPDGAWLIAQGDAVPIDAGPGFLELIDAASGTPLPIRWSREYRWPAWKPD